MTMPMMPFRDTRSQHASTVGPVSRALFVVDLSDGPLIEAQSGNLVARTGERGAWSRGASTLAATAANGAYTAGAVVPAFEAIPDPFGVPRLGLRQGTNDVLSFPWALAPQAMAGALWMVEAGARTSSGATLFALANDAVTGARLWLDTSGSYYRLNYSDGTTTRTATLASGQPSVGQAVRFRWLLTAAGAITLWQSINGGAETTASAAALALPAAWGATARLRIGRRGATANPAALWWRRLVVASAADVDVLETLW